MEISITAYRGRQQSRCNGDLLCSYASKNKIDNQKECQVKLNILLGNPSDQ